MKRIVSFVCALILIIQLCTVAVNAVEVDTAPTGICAVISDQNGSFTLSGAEAAEVPDANQSYELYVDRQPVLSVEAQNSELTATGASLPTFYRAEFMIPDTTLQVFLTGLRSENVEELQRTIIDSFTQRSSFELSDLSFIDTEKTALSDGDENLCWAAASSNILYYTGWGAKAGFSDEDELFDLFASSFNDKGSHQNNAMAWFFNGAALQNNLLSFDNARIKNYPNSGKYFRDYAYDMVSGYDFIRSPRDMARVCELLRQGYGVSPGIDPEQNGKSLSSHAITLWGTVTDLSQDAENAERYQGLLITDSDSDMLDDPDRRKASKILSYYPLYLNEYDQFCFDCYDDITAVLDDYEYLAPYSSELPFETDLATGRDKTKYPDLRIGEVYLSDQRNTMTIDTLFESGSDLCFEYNVFSAADKAWRSEVKTSRTVVSSTGEVLFSDVDSISVSWLRGLNYEQSTVTRTKTLNDVPAGDYTLTLTVNPDRTSTEAYYYNNTRTVEFYVRDSFIRGDSDNSGDVTIFDATCIQRRLAGLSVAWDSHADERSDVDENGLDITDAAYIQRRLCEIDIPYSVGEKALYREL